MLNAGELKLIEVAIGQTMILGGVGPLCCIGADFRLCLGAPVGGGSSGCCFVSVWNSQPCW